MHFLKNLTPTGLELLNGTLENHFDYEQLLSQDDLLKDVPAGQGGIYVGFCFSKEGKLVALYVGRSCNFLNRNASHLAHCYNILGGDWQPGLLYKFANMSLTDSVKAFYSVGKTQDCPRSITLD